MNCKDCKHWAREEKTDWGLCELTESYCGDHNKESKAYAQDSEDYSASLKTAPDFGCVQFEVKT